MDDWGDLATLITIVVFIAMVAGIRRWLRQ
jgi:hypothetical protein